MDQGFAESEARPPEGSTEPTLCPSCGYDLAGLTIGCCPECGYELTAEGLGDPSCYLPFLGRAEVQFVGSLVALGGSVMVGCLWTGGVLLLALTPVVIGAILGLTVRRRNHGRWRGAAYLLWWKLMWPLHLPYMLTVAGIVAGAAMNAAFASYVAPFGLYVLGMWLGLRRAILWPRRWRSLAERAGLPTIVGSSSRSGHWAAWVLVSISALAATAPMLVALAFLLNPP